MNVASAAPPPKTLKESPVSSITAKTLSSDKASTIRSDESTSPALETPQVVQLVIAKPSAESGMNGLEFVSSGISSLAWPLAAIAIALFFRSNIATLLQSISEASWGGAKVNFSRALDRAEKRAPLPGRSQTTPPGQRPLAAPPIDERFEALLKISPSAAIVDSWGGIEKAIRKLAHQNNLSNDMDGWKLDQIVLGLRHKGHLSTAELKTIMELRNLRNRAAHTDEISPTDALRFDELAREVKAALGV